MANKNNLKSNIWKIYVFQIFRNLAFFLPVIVLFWQDNGLTMTEIMILQSLFAIAIVLLEVPTGYFADIFGRKKALSYSGVFLFSGVLVYARGSNFYHFLVAEILWALGTSLISGSDAALVYDSLKDMKREQEYKRIWGYSGFLFMIAIAAANIIGGIIGDYSFRFTFYAMLPFLALLVPLAMSMEEPQRHKLIFKKGYLWELLKIVKYSLIKRKRLRWIIIYSAVIYAFNQAALWFYQPYLSFSGLRIVHFGLVFATFQIAAAFSSKYAYLIEEKIGKKYSLVALTVLVAVSYLLMGNFIYLFSFSFAFLQQFVRGFSRVIITDYIHSLTSSRVRATVISAHSMIKMIAYALLIPFAGLVSDAYSITYALSALGITTLVIGLIILLIIHKKGII